MQGHSHEEGRTIRIDGSHATLLAKFSLTENYIEIRDHRGHKVDKFVFPRGVDDESGHGGGDYGLMKDFLRSIHNREQARSYGRDSLESHLMAFAAEESRHENTVIDMKAYRARAEK